MVIFVDSTASRIVNSENFAELRNIRAVHPDRLPNIYSLRHRRPLLVNDRRLLIVAADHPARGALGVGEDPAAMANRYDLLSRLVLALSRPGVDGVLGSADIIDDLAMLGVLDHKIVVGSMNRGGLAGSVFEMDDRFTGYTVEALRRRRLDFGKLLLRVNLSDAHTAATLESAASVVSAAAAAEIPIMIEPFISTWCEGEIRHDLSTDGVIKSLVIASGLGDSSAFTWLKIPVVPQMDRVMEATTLPTLLLGGDTLISPDEVYARWRDALALPGVRGLVVGRQLLFPANGDVASAVDAAASLVHG